MPKVPIIARKSRPAKPFKKNGELSVAGQDWFLFLENRGLSPDHKGIVEYTKDWNEPNPKSHTQIKEWLFALGWVPRSEEHTSELQSLMRISYAVFCLKKKKYRKIHIIIKQEQM